MQLNKRKGKVREIGQGKRVDQSLGRRRAVQESRLSKRARTGPR